MASAMIFFPVSGNLDSGLFCISFSSLGILLAWHDGAAGGMT